MKIKSLVPNLVISDITDRVMIYVINEQISDKLDELFELAVKSKKFNNVPLFEETFGIHPSHILAYGEVKPNEPPKIFKKYCPKLDSYIKNSENINQPVNSYKCFIGNHSEIRQKFGFVMHEDIYSSWNCVLSKLLNPKYAIIIFNNETRNNPARNEISKNR